MVGDFKLAKRETIRVPLYAGASPAAKPPKAERDLHWPGSF